MKIVIRVDASCNIGTGHVIRCLTLAKELRKFGMEAVFICREHPGNLNFLVKRKGFEVHQLPAHIIKTSYNIESGFPYVDTLGAPWSQDAEETRRVIKKLGEPDWLVIDHYAIGQSWHEVLRSNVKKIFVIDDLANRIHDCDMLLDQTYGRKISDYKDLVPENCKTLLGASFALLRSQFRKLRISARKKRRKTKGVQRIFISLGGMDVDNVTGLVLQGLEKIEWNQRLEIDVVLSNGAPHLSNIKKIANQSDLNVKLHFDVDYIAELMLDADLAIGAGGSTAWERCCLGLPTLTITTADNQKKVIDVLVSTGAAIHLGDSSHFCYDSLIKRVVQLLCKDDACKKWRLLSNNAFKLCDGNGVKRVVREILDGTREVTLREAGMEDCQMVFDWQQEPNIRKYCRNKKPPGWKEHGIWFQEKIQSKNSQLFIIMRSDQSAGMVRLDRLNEKQRTFEISILISPEFQKKGIAKKALIYLRELKPSIDLMAEVFPKNTASVKLFESVGYKKIDNTWFKLRAIKKKK